MKERNPACYILVPVKLFEMVTDKYIVGVG